MAVLKDEPAAVRDRLAVALRRAGAEGDVRAGAPQGYAVAGPEPLATVLPRDEAAVATTVREAREQGWALVVRGGGTADRWGGAVQRTPLIVLDTTALRGVVAHEPGDLTARIRPGTPLRELDAAFAAAGQALALWPPRAATATVGGTIASGAAGPTRLLHGGPRDLLLGLRCVDGGGRTFAAGGRVVKNVSGLDVGKLFVGSFGTLGVLTEVCCKLRPRPPAAERRAAAFGGEAAALAAARAVLEGDFLPAGLTVEGLVCTVAFEGAADDVADEAARLADLWAGGRALPSAAAERAWTAACEPGAGLGTTAALVRCDVPDGALPALAGALAALPGAGRRVAWPGLGVLWAVLEGAGGVPDLAAAVRRARAAAEDCGGAAVLADAPDALRAAVPPWGDPGELRPWMAAIKRRFDPDGILAPGRFAGGL